MSTVINDQFEAAAQAETAFEQRLAGLLGALLARHGWIDGQAGLAPRYARWREASLALLRQHAGTAGAAADWDASLAQWQGYREQAGDDPLLGAQIRLIDVVLPQLPAILKGERAATGVLFPQGQLTLVESIYRDNPVADYFNAVLGERLEAYVRARLAHRPQERLRLLEVGAGTGGTSQGLWPRLAPLAAGIEEYCYTDVSPAFLLHAEQHYRAQAPYLRTQRLDIEAPPVAQGFEVGRYDAIVATNVLHATRDIRRTLRNVKLLLKANGILLINEVASASLFSHLSFGLLDGWWLSQDEALRIPGTPALSPQGWRSALQAEGFGAIAYPAEAAHRLGQQIVLAVSDGVIRVEHGGAVAPVVPDAAPDAAPVRADASRAIAKQAIRASLAATLKLDDAQLLDDQAFSSFGVDSITGVSLVNEINERLGLALPTTVLFDYATVDQLSAYIGTLDGVATAAPEASTASGMPVPAAPATASLPIPDQAPAPVAAAAARQAIRASLAATLKLDDAQLLDDQAFSSFGIDSITGVSLVNEINERLGLALPTTVLFDYASVDQLSAHIGTLDGVAARSASAVPVQAMPTMAAPATIGVPPARTLASPEASPAAPLADKLAAARRAIRASLAATLKLDDAQLLDDQVFSSFGIDSITGVSLVNEINERLGLALPTTVLFDYATVDQLAAHVAASHAQAFAAERDASPGEAQVDASAPQPAEAAPLAATRRRSELPSARRQASAADAPLTASPAAAPSPAATATPKPVSAPSPARQIDGPAYHRVRLERPGTLDALRIESAALAPLGAREVRIAVQAFSLNFGDLLCVRGLYPTQPAYPFTPGFEASGTVIELGAEVGSVAVGDEVIALAGPALGAHATVLDCGEEWVFRRPAKLSPEAACAVPVVALTMIECFAKARLQPGERILIQTATGGTGLIAVQMARHAGAEIIATAGSAAKLEYLARLGVPHRINYREQDFEAEVRRITDGRGVDVVINTLAGEAVQKGINCLAPGGRYIEIAMTALKSTQSIDLSRMNDNQTFHSVDLRKLGRAQPALMQRTIREMGRLLEAGTIVPTVSHRFDFEQIHEAYRALEDRQNIGKIVVSVPEAWRFKARHAAEAATPEPIAVIGMSGRFARTDDVDALWRALAAGEDLIEPVTRWDLSRQRGADGQPGCREGGLLHDIEMFDPLFFNISGTEAQAMDPQQRLFLQEAWHALEDAGHAGDALRGRRCAVYVGAANGDYARLLDDNAPAAAFWGNAGSVIPARIAYHLDLQGPAMAVDTACSSSLVALHLACESLRAGEAELALAGGVFVQSTEAFYVQANRAGMLSPRGRCRAFDAGADGFVPGEGVGAIVLKRLSRALADGDNVIGVIRASGINQDGATNGITAPSARSQARLEKQVYERFGVDPREIQVVEAHGTGTALGDPIEFRALAETFGTREPQARCALGSIKSNLGHAATAAGMAGVIKLLLSLRHRQIPPSLHFEQGNPQIDFEHSAFRVNTALTDWDVPPGRTRLAAISSFGFSGTNAHAVIGEAPAAIVRPAQRPAHLVVLSAQSEAQLRELAGRLLVQCRRAGAAAELELGAISYTLLTGRRHMTQRWAAVVGDVASLAEALSGWLAEGRAAEVRSGTRDAAKKGDEALLRSGERAIADAEQAPAEAPLREALARLADLFVQGVELDWARLFEGQRYRRVSLPTYPFARERYWVPEGGNANAVAGASAQSAAHLHPLVHRNTSDLGGQRYSTWLDGEESFLRDHVVRGQRVVPGVVQLEWARAAVHLALGRAGAGASIRLEQVSWLRPLVVANPITVQIGLAENDDGRIEWEIYSDDGEQTVVYGEGLALAVEDEGEAPRVDLDALRQACERELDVADCYARFETAGLAYGPSLRGLQRLQGSAEVALAEIVCAPSTPAGLSWLPGVLDVALQASVGLAGSFEGLALPFAVEAVRAWGEIPDSAVAIVRNAGSAEAPKLDVTIADTDGTVRLALDGVNLRVVERHDAAPRTLSWVPRWQAAPLPVLDGARHAHHWVLVCGSEYLQGEQADEALLRELGAELPQAQCVRLQAEGTLARRYERYVLELLSQMRRIVPAAGNGGATLLQLVVPASGEGRALQGLHALLRSARQEHPQLLTQVVQVPSWHGIAERVRQEAEALAGGAGAAVVRFGAAGREVLGFVPLAEDASVSAEAPLAWRDGGVYWITGGLGGLGRVFARAIAEAVREPVLVLSGRGAATPEHEAFMQALREGGARVDYRRAEASDARAMAALAAEIVARHGALHGVIHAAGLLHDGLLLKARGEETARVLGPKVAGTVALDEATRDIALDWLVLCSSVAGVLGNVGQAGYAAANGFMDAWAAQREARVAEGRRHGRTLSVSWPLWAEGGMRIDAATQTRMQRSLGLHALPSEAGMTMLHRALNQAEPHVLVLHGEPDGMRRIMAGAWHLAEPAAVAAPARATQAAQAAPTVPARGSANGDDLSTRARPYLTGLMAGGLKLSPERIDAEEPLERYGIDSVLAVKLVQDLEQVFGPLSKTLFFEYQTIAALTQYFVREHATRLAALLDTPIAREAPRLEARRAEPPRQANPAAAAPRVIGTPRGSGRRRGVPAVQPRGVSPVDVSGPLDIAIVGLSGRYPQADTLEEYWQNLLGGLDSITEIPAERWEWRGDYSPNKGEPGKVYAKWGGFLRDVDKFDPQFFNISPREALMMDPQERLFLQCAYGALEDAGYTRAQLAAAGSVGVFVGSMYQEYQLHGVDEASRVPGLALPGSAASIANRVSYFGNFEGPSLAVDTMCSSSLTAIQLACQSIRLGQCAAAIAGGVNVSVHPNKYRLLSQGQFASSKGRCESFGEGGDGYVPGEGVGAVLLKPLAQAEADGDHIYGVIKGSAINHGGKTNGYTVPNPRRQARVIGEALRESGVPARAVSYIEAHGTGTSLGDPIEIVGLTQAFGEYTQDRGFCAIGSAKSNVGHCESAAGMAGLTKLLLQMKHGTLVKSLHSETLNPHIDFAATPFVVQQDARPWQRPVLRLADGVEREYPRVAGLSSFGAGGSNAHLVVQEYVAPARAAAAPLAGPVAIVLSARNAERLQEQAARLLAHLATHDLNLRDLAYTLQIGREGMASRLAIVADTLDTLRDRLSRVVKGEAEVEGVSRGEARRGQGALSIFSDDEELQDAVARWIERGKLAKLAQLWVQGLPVEWSRLYDGRGEGGEPRPRRVSLPTYPFARESYWWPTAVAQGLFGQPARARAAAATQAAEQARRPEPTAALAAVRPVRPIQPTQAPQPTRQIQETQQPAAARLREPVATAAAEPAVAAAGGRPRLSLRDPSQAPAPASDGTRRAPQPSALRPLDAPASASVTAPAAVAVAAPMRPDAAVAGHDDLGALQRELAEDLGAMLMLDSAAIDADTPFIDLGLDSIAGVEWVRRINARHGVSLTVMQMYEHATLRKLAAFVAGFPGARARAVPEGTVVPAAAEAAVQTKYDGRPAAPRPLDTTPSPVPDATPAAEAASVADLGDLQRELAKELGEMLMLDGAAIDADTPFIDLGLDSITGVEWVRKINSRHGLSLTAMQMYEHPTLRALAKLLAASTDERGHAGAAPTAAEAPPAPTRPADPEPSRSPPPVAAPAAPSSLAGPAPDFEPIAVIAMSGRFPDADNLDEYWANLVAGRDCITEIPPHRWSLDGFYSEDRQDAIEAGRSYNKWGGFLRETAGEPEFAAARGPGSRIRLTREQTLFMDTVRSLLDTAGYGGGQASRLRGTRTGVYLGMTAAPGQTQGSLVGMVSGYFDFKGPSIAVDAHSASSMTALHMACAGLARGECSVAIAGGVYLLYPESYTRSCRLNILASHSESRSFAADRDGMLFADCVGALLLKPLSKALADGDTVLAVVRSTAATYVGDIYVANSPSPSPIAAAIRETFERSGIDPRSISYVEAAAAGLPLGDALELSAMSQAFGEFTDERQFCALGSVKTQIGHAAAASGISQLIKVILQMRHRRLVSPLDAGQLSPELPWRDSPFFPQPDSTPWARPSVDRDGVAQRYPRRALVNSMGFGGFYAGAILEEYPAEEHVAAPHDAATAGDAREPLDLYEEEQS
ncbi:SDR family NAD(P)-dependent oxidoreductase [Burkholderia gladioli]|uniref:SDR family NAD(P)-dependent oxidoreductase n=2 Tax=Burkholderia gladioli TaxID=28095 RepID=UPI0016411234|nr:SDR family NAD(P)-dependent oxidoreductase [Burkholderia gladioli]